MLAVDSSVWIDYFRGTETPATAALDDVLDQGDEDVLLPELVLMEVLRGIRTLHELRLIRTALAALPVVIAGGEQVACAAAEMYRALRARGITVRSAIDLLVGAWCIANGVPLLHSDRDFDGMAQHHGLRVVGCAKGLPN